MIKKISESIIRGISPLFFGMGLLVIALFLSIAIISYNKHDPSFNRATSSEVNNLAGEYGAYIADPMLQSLGLVAMLPVLFLIILGIKKILKKRYLHLSLRIAVLLLVTPLVATTLSFLSDDKI